MSPVLLLLLLGACSGRALDAPDPVALALSSAQDDYERRADAAALDVAIAEAWLVLDAFPEDPRVLALLSNGYAARGYGHAGEQALADLDQAYALSRRCLDRNPGWRSRLDVAGGRVGPDVTSRLIETDRACLDATLLALAWRTAERGPAGWVDLRELRLMADRAAELDSEDTDWVPPWAQGMAAALLNSADDPTLETAEGLFREATRREPSLITPAVDRLALVVSRRGDRTRLVRAVNSVRQRYSPVQSDHPWALENRRGLKRLDALLYTED